MSPKAPLTADRGASGDRTVEPWSPSVEVWLQVRLRLLIRRLLLLAGLAPSLLAPGSAPAAEAEAEQASLEQRCVAAAMTVPAFFHTLAYNRHPQSKLESLTWVDVYGNVRRLPPFCLDRYQRLGYVKVLIKSTVSHRWTSVEAHWQSLEMEFGDQHVKTPFFHVSTAAKQSERKPHRDQGCVIQVKSAMKLQLQDRQTGTVIAARFVDLPGEIDSWRTARCRGKLSIRDDARHCPQSVYGVTTTSARSWDVRALAVPCRTAARVGQRALVGYSSDGDLDPRRVAGWTCYYSQNAAASCRRGRARIHLGTNRGRQHIGNHCSSSEVQQLVVLGSACSTARRLSAQITTVSPSQRTTSIDGKRWRCLARQVTPLVRYQCFAPAAAVSFVRPDPAAGQPYPTEIPAATIYPGGGAAAIGRTPLFRLGESFAEDGKVEVELQSEQALIGRPARLKVSLWKWHCLPAKDCYRRRRIGRPRIGNFTLEATEQRVAIGPLRSHGNWSYEIQITTPAFTLGSARYSPAKAGVTYLMLNG